MALNLRSTLEILKRAGLDPDDTIQPSTAARRTAVREQEGREETSDTADHDRNRNREQLPEFDEY